MRRTSAGIDVEAEDEPVDLVEDVESASGFARGGRRPPPSGRAIRFAAFGSSSGAVGSIWTRGVPGPTWTFGTTKTLRTVPANGAGIGISIFIASRVAMRRPFSTCSPGVDADRDDDRGRRRAEDAEVVAREAVRHAVDLDEVVEALEDAEDPVARPAHDEPALEAREVLDAHLAAHAVQLDAVVVVARAGRPSAGSSVRGAGTRSRGRPPCGSRDASARPTRRTAPPRAAARRRRPPRPRRGARRRRSGGSRRRAPPPTARASRCRPARSAPRGGRGARGGTPCSWCRRRGRRRSPRGRDGAGRAPRPGRPRGR